MKFGEIRELYQILKSGDRSSGYSKHFAPGLSPGRGKLSDMVNRCSLGNHHIECVLNIKSANFDQRHAFSGSPRYSKNFLKMKKISTTNARLADWPQSFTT